MNRECCCGMMQEVWASEKAGLEQKALALEGDLQQALDFNRKEAAWTEELQDLKQELRDLQSAQAGQENEHVQVSAELPSAEEQIAASEDSLDFHKDQLVEVLAKVQAQVPTWRITSEAEVRQAISRSVEDALQNARDEAALAQEAKTAEVVQVLCQASCYS